MPVLNALSSTSLNNRSAGRSKTESGPRLRINLRQVAFEKAGRHYLTLTANGQDLRTEVSADSAKVLNLSKREYDIVLGIGEDDLPWKLATLDVRIGAHKLMFSKGAKEIGTGSVSLGKAVINGEAEECEVQLLEPRSKSVVGSVRLSWCVDDRDAAERAAAEQAAAEREAAERAEQARKAAAAAAAEKLAMDRAAQLLASAQKAAVDLAAKKRDAEQEEEDERAALEATKRAQAQHVLALQQKRADEARAAESAAARERSLDAESVANRAAAKLAAERDAEERALLRQQEEEAERVEAELRAMLKAEEEEAEAAAAQREAEEAALREAERVRAVAVKLAADAEAAAAQAVKAAKAKQQWERTRQQWDSKWAAVLESKVVLLRDDGARFELRGRQVVGLCDALRASKKRALAFMHDGVRVTLSSEIAEALRARLDGRMSERSVEGDLFFELPTVMRASTAPFSTPREVPAAADDNGAGVLPRHTISAPPRADAVARPLSQQVVRAAAMYGRRGSSKVAPIAEDDDASDV